MADAPLSIADWVADPASALRRVHEHGAVVPIDFGGVMVVEHAALREALSDARLAPSFTDFLRQMGVTSGPFYEWMAMSPLEMDGEEHLAWRRLMTKTFTPRSVERLQPFLEAEARKLVDSFAADGRCEFVGAFARKLPSIGLCELIGVPAEDRDAFGGWADTIGLGFNLMLVTARIAEIDEALTRLREYSRKLIESRLREPKDDLVTRLAQAGRDEDMGAHLMEGSIAGLVFAGHETTKNQLGWMIAVLADAPDEWDRVAKAPERARDVVEEVMRLRAAATSVGRTTREDVTIAGCPIQKGTRVIGSLWSANHDPAAFPNPAKFDPDGHRAASQIGFGYGPHHCIGAALARAELRESLVALATRITCPKVETGATWLPPIGINGPLTLPISFRERG